KLVSISDGKVFLSTTMKLCEGTLVRLTSPMPPSKNPTQVSYETKAKKMVTVSEHDLQLANGKLASSPMTAISFPLERDMLAKGIDDGIGQVAAAQVIEWVETRSMMTAFSPVRSNVSSSS